MNSKNHCSLLALALLGATISLPALAQGDLAQAGLGDGSVVLDPGLGGPRIEVVGRGWIEPELPPGGLLTEIWQLAGGWLATGTRPLVDGEEMLLMRGGAELVTEELSPPPRGAALLRGGAVPFAADGGLRGLAWLEGDGATSLAVRAASRDEGEWGEVEVVSRPGPGSQANLSGAVLADGSWLLVWTAFDGTDHDVVWSRRANGEWSLPRRVHADNDTPDMLPRVHATGFGALLAWSWMDGSDYRLKLAAYGGGRWRVSDFLGGKGSLYPAFYAEGDELYLLYRNVDPATWNVLGLEADGRVWREAVLAEASRERPVLDAVEGSEVHLRWPVRWIGPEPPPSVTAPASDISAPADRIVAVDWQVVP